MSMKVNGTSGLTFPDSTTLASAGQSSVRAWVNFNGTGTVAIRASFNVSSITDNGVGDYTVNFTTALPDANYAPIVSGKYDESNADQNGPAGSLRRVAQTTSSVRVLVGSMTGNVLTPIDCIQVNVAVFR